nr:helix-turn-helix transcriptional regulator [Alistipes finegoldii]
MREKLLDLMKNEGLKPSQLAELLGINPAGISHILAGRNKPGFDLLQKIPVSYTHLTLPTICSV